MKRSEAFPSKYLSQDDVDPAVRATISGLRIEMLKSEEKGDEQKPILLFREDIKPLILNNTNWTTLEDAYGEDSDLWVGKTVEIYRDPNVMMGKKKVGGVRFRIPQAQAPVQPLSFDEAVALAATVGISRDLLVADLKASGKTGYVPARDTDQVVQLVEDKKAQDANKELAF